MEFQYIPVLLSLAALCLITDCCLAGECTFQYVRQPPSNTIQDCDPYDQENRIRITLQCIVRTQDNLNGTYKIKWFLKNTNGHAAVDLGIGSPITYFSSPQGSSRFYDTISTYHNKNFLRQQYNPSFLGKYWCQVINTTADPENPLMRSNVFTLLPPDNYDNGSCIHVATLQFIDKVTCANQTEGDQLFLPTAASVTLYSSTQVQQSANHVHETTPFTSMVMTVPTAHFAGAVSGIVVLVLLFLMICSTLIVILIVMKRRRTQNGPYRANSKEKEFDNSAKNNTNRQCYENTSKFTFNDNTSSQPVYAQPNKIPVYAEVNKTRADTNKEENVVAGTYHLLGDATTGAVMFDDPTYDAAGGSNSQYLHLEDAVTKGKDTEYTKLSHDGTTSHITHNQTTHVDANKVVHSTDQQYSTLQHHTMSPTTDSDKRSHFALSDQQQYSALNNTAL